MARGWESKSIEQQQEEHREQPKGPVPVKSAEQLERDRKREGLCLSQRRLAQQLEAADNPRHRQMLEAALADLERQLASLG